MHPGSPISLSDTAPFIFYEKSTISVYSSLVYLWKLFREACCIRPDMFIVHQSSRIVKRCRFMVENCLVSEFPQTGKFVISNLCVVAILAN